MKVQKAITLWMVYLLGKVYRIVINGINEFQCGRKEMENWIERNNVWSVGNVTRSIDFFGLCVENFLTDFIIFEPHNKTWDFKKYNKKSLNFFMNFVGHWEKYYREVE